MNQKTRNRHVPLRRNASIFFIFLFCFGDDLLGRERERARGGGERNPRLWAGKCELGDFSFYSLFVDVAISVSTDRLSRDLSE